MEGMTIFTRENCPACEMAKSIFPLAGTRPARELVELDGGIDIITNAKGALPILEINGTFWVWVGKEGQNSCGINGTCERKIPS